MPAKGYRKPLAKRFEGKYAVCDETGCWNWTAATSEGRYGVIWFADGKSKYAHRVSYEFHIGPLPEGMSVCHRCDNGLCVNPGHLFAGTAKDNYDDMARKGRRPNHKGENNPSAKLTVRQVDAIMALQGGRLSQEAVAKRFAVSRATIKKVWNKSTCGPETIDWASGALSLPG